MARKSSADVAKKWRSRLENSADDIKAGIQSVTVAPTQQAKKKQDVMKARVVQAIDNGKWAAGLDRVSLGDWQQAMLTKGVQRVTQGAADSEGKVSAFMDELLPFTERVSNEIQSMANTTDADRKARMMANFDKMKQFKRRGR